MASVAAPARGFPATKRCVADSPRDATMALTPIHNSRSLPCTVEWPEAQLLVSCGGVRAGIEVCLCTGGCKDDRARVTDVAWREITLEILAIEQPQRELLFALEVAAPLPKGDRSQFLFEKL